MTSVGSSSRLAFAADAGRARIRGVERLRVDGVRKDL
jgi:hypothetical protein